MRYFHLTWYIQIQQLCTDFLERFLPLLVDATKTQTKTRLTKRKTKLIRTNHHPFRPTASSVSDCNCHLLSVNMVFFSRESFRSSTPESVLMVRSAQSNSELELIGSSTQKNFEFLGEPSSFCRPISVSPSDIHSTKPTSLDKPEQAVRGKQKKGVVYWPLKVHLKLNTWLFRKLNIRKE